MKPRPRYFYNDIIGMLYVVYKDNGVWYAGATDWVKTDWGIAVLAYFEKHEHYHPCSLADVRASFNNIKAHKRDSTNSPAGTLPA